MLEAAAYAGRSLARVGLDISALLGPAASAAVRALLQRQLALAAAMFLAAVDAHRWVVMPVAAHKARPDAQGGEGDGGAAVLEAAQGLLSHPPLAVLVNAVRVLLKFRRDVVRARSALCMRHNGCMPTCCAMTSCHALLC